MEILRRLKYGDQATARIQKVLEIVNLDEIYGETK